MIKSKISVKLIAGFVAIVLLSMLMTTLLFFEMFRQFAFDNREKVMLQNARNIASIMADNPSGMGLAITSGTGLSTADKSSTPSGATATGTPAPNGNPGTPGTPGWPSPFRQDNSKFMRFLDNSSGARVWVTDKNGNTTTSPGPAGRRMDPGPLPAEAQKVMNLVLAGKEARSEDFSGFYNETTLTVGVPVKDSSDAVIGAVFLHSPITGVSETMDKAVRIQIISISAALALAILLGIFYSLLFTRPLQAMNKAAMAMAGGNYGVRTGVDRADELGQLGHSLDHLAAKLEITINQLFEEKGKLNDIIASISEGILAFDTELRPTGQNAALAEILNLPVDYSENDICEVLNTLQMDPLFREVFDNKQNTSHVREWAGRKLRLTLSPILDNAGQCSGGVVLVQDISQSEKLEQMRRDFVANVSHEFRTPLTIIRGYLEAMSDGTVSDSEDMQKYHRRMLLETRGLERLVADLLDLSGLQSGKLLMNKEELYLPDLVNEVIRGFQSISDKKGIQICYNADGEIPMIMGDYTRLRQLLIIFLDNAIKFSNEQSKIDVTLRKTDNLHLIIQDYGCGISGEDLPFIWERFYKTDKSRAYMSEGEKTAGTGLGLAIARHLIELHGGTIHVTSKSGEGTTFDITLQ